MAKKKGLKSFCESKSNMSCCNVEAFVSIDERGQMVLPKNIREKAKINAGDKLALVTCEVDGNIKIISLIRTDDFSEMVKDFMGPVMGEVFSK